MLERVIIQNFQSLKKLDLELGKFTVIVGPSSSGKSAFLRAMRGLASNIRGSSVITSGEKSLAISLYKEKEIVTLKKTATAGKYLVTDRETGEEKPFTKLAQKVPEGVTEVLNIQPVTTTEASINFAGQFDKPYLLGESASQVAKVLGDLTNVSSIFEAVRLANKKKLAVSALLKTRQSDFNQLKEEAAEFAGLATRRKALAEAESLLEEATELRARQRQLQGVLSSLIVSEGVLASLVEFPEVPSLDELEALQLDYLKFKNSIVAWAKALKAEKEAEAALELAISTEKESHELLHSKLQEVGKCPTCDQIIPRS